MTEPQRRFVWCELMTTNAAAAKTFYKSVVGWGMQDMPMPGMTYTVLSAGETPVGGLMTMPQEPGSGGPKPCWLGYVGVEDVDAAAARVQKLGGTVHRAPADIPNVGRFAVVADPQGAMFQLFKSAQPTPPSASQGPGHVGWHELHTRDWPQAFEFYSALFGWYKGQGFDMGAMGTYQLFTIGDAAVGGMFDSPAAESIRFWLFYFNVGDIDAAAGRVTGGGGKITQGPTQVPGGGWIVQASDPQGAMFALLGTRP